MPKYWGIIPAAGIGRRMGGPVPKQFLKIKDKTIIEWTILALAQHEQVDGLYVGLEKTEQYADWIKSIHPKVLGVFEGGDTRSETVLNGISYLVGNGCSEDDWLLVHDANRPLLTMEEITRLIETVGDDENGGIVSLPVFDTLKSGTDGKINSTVNREHCFRALTPQMFKLGLLHKALLQCVSQGFMATDESQAMERLGHCPKLIPGSVTNIKITAPSDLRFAEAIIGLEQSDVDQIN